MRTAAPDGISSTPLHRHDGGAPAVVFLHGIGGAARAWAPQIVAFKAAGLHPVALDLPGYGARPAVDTMDFEALAADLEATIERLGLEPGKPVYAVIKSIAFDHQAFAGTTAGQPGADADMQQG